MPNYEKWWKWSKSKIHKNLEKHTWTNTRERLTSRVTTRSRVREWLFLRVCVLSRVCSRLFKCLLDGVLFSLMILFEWKPSELTKMSKFAKNHKNVIHVIFDPKHVKLWKIVKIIKIKNTQKSWKTHVNTRPWTRDVTWNEAFANVCFFACLFSRVWVRTCSSVSERVCYFHFWHYLSENPQKWQKCRNLPKITKIWYM